MSPASAFDRKPTLPRLMPMSGTSTSVTAIAARRNVPSPPSTTRMSVVGSSRTRAAVSPEGSCHSPMPRIWHQPAARALSSTAASIVGL